MSAAISAGNKVEIKVLDGSHAEAWWRLRLEGLEREPGAFLDSADQHRAMPVEEATRRLNAASDEDFVLGALISGELAGIVGFAREKAEKHRHTRRSRSGQADAACGHLAGSSHPAVSVVRLREPGR